MKLLHVLIAALWEGIYWLFLNALGIGAYLAIESWILAPRSEGGPLNGIDQIYLWITTDLPILMVFITTNGIWLLLILRRSHASNNSEWSIWLLVCLAWGVALIYYGIATKIIAIVVGMIIGR